MDLVHPNRPWCPCLGETASISVAPHIRLAALGKDSGAYLGYFFTGLLFVSDKRYEVHPLQR
jgi:hypothetical protein